MGPWLYIVLLGACIMLYAWLRPSGESGRPSTGIDEIEATLEQFAQELEEDNRKLLEAVGGVKGKLEGEIMKLSGRVDVLEKQLLAYAQQSTAQPAPSPQPTTPSSPPGEPAVPEEEAAATAGPEHQTAPVDMKSRYPELFHYYEQGKSIEYIAKKTGMNKGEVQLIIQLAKQEEEFRVEG